MQLLTIRLNDVKFGIPIESVQSIEERIQTVSIPRSLPYIKGIMNLHGDIVPVYSLAEKFGYPQQEISNIVVTNVNNTLIGFEVNRVEEILEVSDKDVVPMPNLIGNQENFIPEVAHHNKQLIVLLNVNEVVAAEEQQNIKAMLEETKANV
ncbi:chemotaxis protein CheW [Roseburia hominis]|uniref:chemotaxis protein CheW n=1 Tax=Roseburia hominis TaxID=301301 RepID=UPI001F3DD297|nr:chemotaxis protein CheW [Roseburia hominis]